MTALLTPMAMLVLSAGSWPLSVQEATHLVVRFFVGKCGTPPEKRKLMAKLGVEGDKFPIALATAHASLVAHAALAELMLLGYAEVRRTGPPGVAVGNGFRYPPRAGLSYSRTAEGAKAMAGLHGRVAIELRRGGWG